MKRAYISRRNYLGNQTTLGEPGQDGEDGSSNMDFTNLNKSFKSDLSLASQLPHGRVHTYTAASTIENGSVCVMDHTTSSNGELLTSKPISVPGEHDVIGIALNDAAQGESVDIVTSGYGTVKYTTQTQSPAVVLLTQNYGNTPFTNGAYEFRDSGDLANDYGNSQNTWIAVFDAGENNTWSLSFGDFSFEHSTYAMYDRLGVQSSTDNSTWTNLSVNWMQASSSSSSLPWSQSFGGSSWNSSNSKNGWILPKDTTRAILNGMDSNNPVVTVNDRFVRFVFYSDSSTTAAGWDISLQSSGYTGGAALPVQLGVPVYVNNTDFSKVSTDNSSGSLIGHSSSTDASNNAIFVKI